MTQHTSTKPTVLITGALSGIGRATALAFAREGAQLVVSGRHADRGNALVAELKELGVEAEFVQADVRRDDEMRALVDRTVARFGRLDVAINNAGTEGHPGLVVDQSNETYRETFETNVLGTLLSIGVALERTLEASGHPGRDRRRDRVLVLSARVVHDGRDRPRRRWNGCALSRRGRAAGHAILDADESLGTTERASPRFSRRRRSTRGHDPRATGMYEACSPMPALSPLPIDRVSTVEFD